MASLKPLEFRSSALQDLKKFPVGARRKAGYQLELVQRGKEPDDWKPMPQIGAGVGEIRIRELNGTYRVVFVAKFMAAVFVLHCFQKKSDKTPKSDVDLAAQRFRDLLKELA